MNKKIFYSIWLVTISVLISCIAFLMVILYNYFTSEQLEQLRNETKLVTQGVIMNRESYFENLDTTDFRITWITPEGQILYDNEADTTAMENHLEREEIQDALENGYGESSRYSSTLSEKQLYTAQRLPDGTVLRLSMTQAAIWIYFLRFSVFVVIAILLALLLSRSIAFRLSKKIVEPLNKINLEEPMDAGKTPVYEEIRPLLKRLDEQYKQIQKDREELEKASLIRQEFTANASHELKTPLHVISGYAELLEHGMVKEEDIPSFAGKIRAEAQRMTKLVEDIIDLSKLDSGGKDMNRENTDLYRIAQNAAESLEAEAEQNRIHISVEGESTIIEGIPQVLYSMVYNLCLNAVKYSDSGNDVRIRVENREKEAVLSVTDHGIGIPKEELDRIFERFYRVDKSRSKEVGGTGLGLSIVKHGAKIHDAEIQVSSEVGEGSVFTVIFPK
ncbi:MAG: ATP-binding protein [Solobacterium sp.]|nr:ATP-binding protein [Solobacterium sp.]